MQSPTPLSAAKAEALEARIRELEESQARSHRIIDDHQRSLATTGVTNELIKFLRHIQKGSAAGDHSTSAVLRVANMLIDDDKALASYGLTSHLLRVRLRVEQCFW